MNSVHGDAQALIRDVEAIAKRMELNVDKVVTGVEAGEAIDRALVHYSRSALHDMEIAARFKIGTPGSISARGMALKTVRIVECLRSVRGQYPIND